jgi:UDP-N-acetylmuramoylalanine--D-glutamate ligase
MPTKKTNSFRLFEQAKETYNPRVGTLSEHLIRLRQKNIAESLSDFEGSAHKLERVKSFSGVEFIDDARSTTANAVWYSLQSMTRPTVWITNIDTPEVLTDDILEEVRKKVKEVVLQGVYNVDVYQKIAETGVPVMMTMSMEDAVNHAFYSCERGDVVLYAPGIHGSGQVTYRERGERFKASVAQL